MSKEIQNESFDVRYIADLAMLSLDAEKAEMYQNELKEIVAFADSIKEVDIEVIDFGYDDNVVKNTFREDSEKDKYSRDEMLKSVSVSDGEFIVVPKVVEE